MEKDPKEPKFTYPTESGGESRAREILHDLSTLFGEVRSYNPIKLPISFFGDKSKELIDSPKEKEFVKVTEYQRHDVAVWQFDTGELPGDYGVTLIERDRYHKDEPVEPINLSMELKTSLGSLIISATIPSRHFSEIAWPRSKEETSAPKIVAESSFAAEEVAVKTLAEKFLEETKPENRESFMYLLEMFKNAQEGNRLEFSPEDFLYIARFFEKFTRGETQEEIQ